MSTVALVGNPNSGKTTLFNALTGSNQYVGNWAGVTVEKKSGMTKKGTIKIIDLPGIYSLSPYSLEEKISLNYILDDNPDLLINIIDGTNIERNLYLTVQLIELGKPMILVVNMMDDLLESGGTLDCDYLSSLLGMQVVPISARRGDNIDMVITAVERAISCNLIPPEIHYDRNTQNALNSIYSLLYNKNNTDIPYNFFSGKILEGNEKIIKQLNIGEVKKAEIEYIITQYEKVSEYGDREAMLADARFKYIENIVKKTVVKPADENYITTSDKIDYIVTNKYLAIPVFMLIMFGMFSLTFGKVGSFFSHLIDKLFSGFLSPVIEVLLTKIDAPDWLFGLIIDAILNGVGGILTFLPQIAMLFFCLSILEDSGYMARAAFITDRFLSRLGLSGKSFIPMLMGFGCTTPAVMAARTQENIQERRLTILLVPFMSCGAKLPIYALFANAFFKEHKGLVVFSMYLIGFFVGIVTGFVLKKTIFKGVTAPFVMELPAYHMPMPSAVLKNTWEKCKNFIVKAGTLIFVMTIIIWTLQFFTPTFEIARDSSDSIFGILGTAIAPILKPLGFGFWQAGVAILAGLIAKEAVVSTMLVLYATSSEAALIPILSSVFTPLSAFSFMVFCLLYVPCISAFASIKRELGSFKWAFSSAIMQTGIAYTLALLIYQIGSLFV